MTFLKIGYFQQNQPLPIKRQTVSSKKRGDAEVSVLDP